MDNSIPKKIFLQWCNDDGIPIDIDGNEDITWCEDRQSKFDEEYHHVSIIERFEKEKEWLINKCTSLMPALENNDADAKVETTSVIWEMQQALNQEGISEQK